MKEEIMKIMSMNKEGKISDDQAAELLAALKSEDKEEVKKPEIETEFQSTEETAKQSKGLFDLSELGGLISELVNVSIEGAMGEVREAIKDVKTSFKSTGASNNSMSKVEKPTGENYLYEDNQFHVSYAKGIHLDDCEMTDNQFHASRVDELKIYGGSLRDGQFQGSSVEEMELVDSNIDDVKFQGTKTSKLLIKDSGIQDLVLQGASLKSLEIVKARWTDVQLKGVSCSNTKFFDSKFEDVVMNGCSLKGTTFSGIEMTDTHWKNVKLIDCEVSNVQLEDFQISDINLTGKVINSTEEFLQLIK